MRTFPARRDPAVLDELRCDRFLDSSGHLRKADLLYRDERWQRCVVGEPCGASSVRPLLVPAVPVDFHCHGLGSFDFSRLRPEDLTAVNRLALQQGIDCVITVFLLHDRFEGFLELMAAFGDLRDRGDLPGIVGFAVEGPLLGSVGGLPRAASWRPSRREWERIADCGEQGLEYIVLSADAYGMEAGDVSASPSDAPRLAWIVECLVERGVRPAFGHFRRQNPARSAQLIEDVLCTVERKLGCSSACCVLTDHLFNDMPRAFVHAWRTAEERLRRDREIAELAVHPWSWKQLDQQIGPVPATLMRAARDGRLTVCLNFDGEHVDLEICRHVVGMLGSQSIVAITDRIETPEVAGERLIKNEGSTLHYRRNGVVAVGSQNVDQQMANMRSIQLDEKQIWQMMAFNPGQILGRLGATGAHPHGATYIDAEGGRSTVYSPLPSEAVSAWQEVDVPLRRASRELAYESPWMKLYVDEVAMPGGEASQYGVVERRDFVAIVARCDDRILMVRQYRYPINLWTWELPQGAIDGDEAVETAARRELLEETGYLGRVTRVWGKLYEASAFATHGFHVVEMRVRGHVRQKGTGAETGISAHWLSLARVRELLAAGSLQDGPSLAALSRLLLSSPCPDECSQERP